jgi:anti-anti-sigma regulatory factor
MGNAGDHAGGDGARLNVTSDLVAGREELRIHLATIMDATMVRELREVLSQAISSNRPVRVDAGAVGQISTGCAQMLLGGAKSAARTGNTFTVSDQSDAFKAAFDDLGLSEIREDWTSHQ